MQQSKQKFPVVLALGLAVLLLAIAQQLTPPMRSSTGVMPMLEDPEAETYDWDFEFWAFNDLDAAEQCRKKAELEQLTRVIGRPQRLTKRPSIYGHYKYRCIMRSSDEDIPYYDPTTRQQQPQ